MRVLHRLALTLLVTAAAACGGGAPPTPGPSPERLPFAPALEVDFARMTKTPTGLYYRDLAVGSGALVEKGQNLSVRYTGWLNNGVEFERIPAGAKPISFKLGRGQVIQGWDQGIEGMRIGGRRQIVVPPELAYGSDRRGNIPGDATLVFVIEMVGAKWY